MMRDISDIQPNIPTYVMEELQGTDDYPYIMVGNHLVIIPQGKTVRELGEIIKAYANHLIIPDKYGLEGTQYIGRSFLTLFDKHSHKYVCIYNLEPQDSAALCYYLTGDFIASDIGFLERMLCLPPATIRSYRNATQYLSMVQECINTGIQSNDAVC